MAYRTEEPIRGDLVSSETDDHYTTETYIDGYTTTEVTYRDISDMDGDLRRIEVSRQSTAQRPYEPVYTLGRHEPIDPSMTTYNFRGVAELPAQEIIGQYQPIEFSQSGLTWTAEGPVNIEGSVIDMTAFNPIDAYDRVTIGHLNTKAINPEVEELKNEVQELKDRIDKLEMLLLEN
jgi:hypothetical protein